MLLLGVKAGTKSGRPQFVFVREQFLIDVVRLPKQIVGKDELVVGLSHLGQFGTVLKLGGEAKGLQKTGWTPHSGRAGHATAEYLAQGAACLPELQETCRWSSLRSLKIYLDVVGVAASQQSQFLEHKHGALADQIAITFQDRLLTALSRIVRRRAMNVSR